MITYINNNTLEKAYVLCSTKNVETDEEYLVWRDDDGATLTMEREKFMLTHSFVH